MAFKEWDTNLCRIFRSQSINSFSYRYEVAFSYGTPTFALPKLAGPKIDLKWPLPLAHPMPKDKCHLHGPPQLVSPQPGVLPYQQPWVQQYQPPGGHRPPLRDPPQPPPLPPPEPTPTLDRRGRGTNVPQSGKSQAMVPLLRWTGITGATNLPDILKTWRLAAPTGTVRTTPNISGKWLYFKFCTEGLFCQPNPGRTCDFTHVDLAQPNPWN